MRSTVTRPRSGAGGQRVEHRRSQRHDRPRGHANAASTRSGLVTAYRRPCQIRYRPPSGRRRGRPGRRPGPSEPDAAPGARRRRRPTRPRPAKRARQGKRGTKGKRRRGKIGTTPSAPVDKVPPGGQGSGAPGIPSGHAPGYAGQRGPRDRERGGRGGAQDEQRRRVVQDRMQHPSRYTKRAPVSCSMMTAVPRARRHRRRVAASRRPRRRPPPRPRRARSARALHRSGGPVNAVPGRASPAPRPPAGA